MQSSRLPTMLLLAGLAAWSGCTNESPDGTQPEPCNGVDDSGDGRVDEACPCAPFSLDLPFRVHSAVSLGDGWALVANGLTASPNRDTQADYIRIDAAGTVLIRQPLDGVVWGERRQLAWDGERLAYLAGTPVPHLAFIAPDGANLYDGPEIEIADLAQPAFRPPSGQLAATPAGYDVAFSVFAPTGAPYAHFTSTDRNGVPVIPTTHVVNAAGSYTFALGSLGGTAVVGWSPRKGGGAGNDRAYAGPPFAESTEVGATFGSFSGGDGTGDGATMVMVLQGNVRSFDGATVGSIALDDARAIAWTGDAYAVAVLKSSGLHEARLARDGSILSESSTPLVTAVGSDADAVVAADAARALFGLFYRQAGGGTRQVLAQVCL